MFTALRTLLRPSPVASSSKITLPPLVAPRTGDQVRFRGQLAPKRTKYKKSQKGLPGLPTGGSLKGTSLEQGQYGIRLLASTRLSAAQLTAAQVAIKRKIKPVKGAECYLRVFPDVPVCVKGNETRMGKGKGSFEFWACRVPVGRVVFEIGGGDIREEIARQALKLAQVKLPVPSEFITVTSPPRLGALADARLAPPPSALPVPAQLAELDAKDQGGARDVVLKREGNGAELLASAASGVSAGHPQPTV